MLDELSVDTYYKRYNNIKMGFQNMISSLDSLQQENNHIYNDIIIIVNPIMPKEDVYIEASVKILNSLAKREILYRVNESMKVPKFHLLLLDYSAGFNCSDYYNADKDIEKRNKEQVKKKKNKNIYSN